MFKKVFLSLATLLFATCTFAEVQLDTFVRYFSGTYRGVTPGNDLVMTINPIFAKNHSPLRTYYVTISGKYNRVNVYVHGVIELNTYGKYLSIHYVPDHNPASSELFSNVEEITRENIDDVCEVFLQEEGDGYGGHTRMSECARAIRGTAA